MNLEGLNKVEILNKNSNNDIVLDIIRIIFQNNPQSFFHHTFLQVCDDYNDSDESELSIYIKKKLLNHPDKIILEKNILDIKNKISNDYKKSYSLEFKSNNKNLKPLNKSIVNQLNKSTVNQLNNYVREHMSAIQQNDEQQNFDSRMNEIKTLYISLRKTELQKLKERCDKIDALLRLEEFTFNPDSDDDEEEES